MNTDLFQAMAQSILDGDTEVAEELARQAIQQGIDPLEAIEKGLTKPEKWIQDPGFALTQENMAEREMDMWGCRILKEADTGVQK